MSLIKNKPYQFLLIVMVGFIFYIFYPQLFWEITVTPHTSLDSLMPATTSYPSGTAKDPAHTFSRDFFDLRYLQYLSGYFESFFLPSDELYNSYKNHSSMMKISYPRVWIGISHFINIESEKVMYTLYFTIFLLYTNVFFYYFKITNSYFFFYLYFSGVSLLLLERGNVDIILIVLLFYSLMSKYKFLNYIGFLISSFLKYYPIFGLFYFLENKKSIITILLLSIIFVGYVFLTWEDILNVASANGKNGDSAYGFLSMTINMKNYFNINVNNVMIILINLFFILLLYKLKFKKKLASTNFQYCEIFLLGGGIYIFTFLFDTHHDYRMIFLLFCMPLILMMKDHKFKFLYIIIIILAFELQRLIFLFGFWGGAINTLSKLILFYLTSIVYLDIIEKKLTKVINSKNFINE